MVRIVTGTNTVVLGHPIDHLAEPLVLIEEGAVHAFHVLHHKALLVLVVAWTLLTFSSRMVMAEPQPVAVGSLQELIRL